MFRLSGFDVAASSIAAGRRPRRRRDAARDGTEGPVRTSWWSSGGSDDFTLSILSAPRGRAGSPCAVLSAALSPGHNVSTDKILGKDRCQHPLSW